LTGLTDSVAVRRYLQRHIEPGLPAPPEQARWRHVLVIPAYREPAQLVQSLQALPAGSGATLVILVLNRPDSDPDAAANTPLRDALAELSPAQDASMDAPLRALADHADILVLDLEQSLGAIPASRGVGLARKVGCDLALQWVTAGAIEQQWIYCTDADAELPDDYFHRLADLQAPAAVFPFRHVPGADARCFAATALYEQRLHQYVRGLAGAGSPYAFHTIGSCIAVQANAYAKVRGVPQRAGAEDFYLLNKLAKLAPIASLAGEPVRLTARRSDRVPFGTGPAVSAIMADGPLERQPVFYAPRVFDALRAVLDCVPSWWRRPGEATQTLLRETSMEPFLATTVDDTLTVMGILEALAHCRRQSRDAAQFARQFHQWFDGFRTLKFVQALTASVLPRVSLSQLHWPA
jgi:hypothetical protein